MKMGKKYLIAIAVVLLILNFGIVVADFEPEFEQVAVKTVGGETPEVDTSTSILTVNFDLMDVLDDRPLNVVCQPSSSCIGKTLNFTIDIWAMTEAEATNFKTDLHTKRDTGTFNYSGKTYSNRFRQFLLGKNTPPKTNHFSFPTNTNITLTKNSEYWASTKVKKDEISPARLSGEKCANTELLKECVKKVWDSSTAKLSDFVAFIEKVKKEEGVAWDYYITIETEISSGKYVSSDPIKLQKVTSDSTSTDELIGVIPFDSKDYSNNCNECASVKECLACIDQKIVNGVWK